MPEFLPVFDRGVFSYPIALSLEQTVTLRFMYNVISKAWYMDVLNATDRTPIIGSIKVVYGIDLFGPFQHLVKGQLIARPSKDFDDDDKPKRESFSENALIIEYIANAV